MVVGSLVSIVGFNGSWFSVAYRTKKSVVFFEGHGIYDIKKIDKTNKGYLFYLLKNLINKLIQQFDCLRF